MNWWNDGGWGSDGNSAFYLYKIEGGGQAEYPIYYDEKSDPPDNVTFTSMTEAESYECTWWGMSADIDNIDYIFCEGNEWLTKYTYIEVSGDYICDNGDKYKKMQEYDRIPDGSTTAHTPTTYVKGDLIESASTDCQGRLPQGYTEVEYIRNSNYNAYIDTGVVLFDNTTNTYTITTKLTSEFHSNLACATIITCENPISTPAYYGLGYRYKCSSTVNQFEFYGSYPNYRGTVTDNGDGTRTVTFQSTGNTS
jgi:hypothetical protein